MNSIEEQTAAIFARIDGFPDDMPREEIVDTLLAEERNTLHVVMAVRHRWGLSLVEARNLVEPRIPPDRWGTRGC